jgi:N-acetylglucosaminyldiphosphoundecaprenol N-acetyl-beta-D-mannosaminyltransferase
MKKKLLLNLAISTSPYEVFVSRILESAKVQQSKYICVANVHMLIESYRSSEFASVVNNADFITPDGKPLTWGLRLVHGIKQDRVAGMDILPDLLKEACELDLPVYFYGGSEEMLGRTKMFLNNFYPHLKIAGLFSPPFRVLTVKEETEVINRINLSGAKLVFVILGCPKQEKWMANMKGKVNAVMIGVGGALPVLVGMQKRAPLWMQNAGLEWLFRLCQEPRRLFKRYAVTNSLFLYLLAKEVIKVRFLKRESSISTL